MKNMCMFDVSCVNQWYALIFYHIFNCYKIIYNFFCLIAFYYSGLVFYCSLILPNVVIREGCGILSFFLHMKIRFFWKKIFKFSTNDENFYIHLLCVKMYETDVRLLFLILIIFLEFLLRVPVVWVINLILNTN